MKIGSLFSGYGGLDMAAKAVFGGTTVWHSEVDPHASKVLALRWPGVPNLGDITAVDWSTVEPVDVIAGGFPCQDISSAGRGAGIKEGTRSGLWYRYADAVRVLRPRFVLVENVGALVVRGLDIVVGDLAALGYDAEWTSLRASDVGAPHRRERIFLLAWPAAGDAAGGGWGQCFLSGGGFGGSSGASRGAGGSTADAPHLGYEWPGLAWNGRPRPAHGGDVDADAGGLQPERRRDVRHLGGATPSDEGAGWERQRVRDAVGDRRANAPADADDRLLGVLGCGVEGSTPGGQWSDQGSDRGSSYRGGGATPWGPYAAAVARWEHITGHPAPSPTDERGRLNAPFAEWMMGLPPGWVTGPDVEALGVPRSAQLRMIGNGVVPRQAEAAGRILLERACSPLAVAS